MSYLFKYLKAYASEETGAVPTEFKQVFYESDISTLNVELAFENLQHNKSEWTTTIKISCFRFSKSSKQLIYIFNDKINVVPSEKLATFQFGKRQEATSKIWTAGEYQWEVQLGQGLFETTNFYINNKPPDVSFELESFSLYEGSVEDMLSSPAKIKDHQSTFEIGRTRCVRAAGIFKNNALDTWKEEFVFKFYNEQTNEVIGITPVIRQINGQEKFVVTGGWGTNRLGNWKEGKFKVCLEVQNKLIAEKTFDCVEKEILETEPSVPIIESPIEHDFSNQKNPLLINLDQLKPFPDHIEDKDAVLVSYKGELDKIADYLRNGLSVLVVCDKILVEFIYLYVCLKADKDIIIDKSYDIKDLYEQIEALRKGEVMILRSIDILQYSPMGAFLLYHTLKGQNAQFLAFNDPSQSINKVLTNRFSVHVPLLGMPKQIRYLNPKNKKEVKELNVLTHLVTKKEKACFKDYNPESLYKQVASLNIIQFRQAMKYIGTQFTSPTPSKRINQEIRQFKVDMLGDDIEIPTTTFEDIGGYDKVKHLLQRMLNVFFNMQGGADKKLQIRSKGFIFHGPPGTGKTLFAKAIANEMNATIQMISGPEIMEKWVGQSEANMRKVFATARRNAPSVILFDEFDSIAGKRSTEANDGGARVGNSLMAQLLTELDGFREDEGILIIGTTNILEAIDKALLRPSRLTAVEIGKPDFDARKQVAKIHAKNLDVDKVMKDLFLLANKYLDEWKAAKEAYIPEQLLDELYEGNPRTRQRRNQEFAIQNFQSELTDFFKFILSLKKGVDHFEQESSLITQIEIQLDKLGKKYGFNLADFEKTYTNKEDQTATALTEVDSADPTTKISFFDSDLHELFHAVYKSKLDKGEVSADAYFDAVLNLIAEFTEDFNNDQIRLIFQEAYIDFISSGQIITPRYLGQKIGLIQNDKDKTEGT